LYIQFGNLYEKIRDPVDLPLYGFKISAASSIIIANEVHVFKGSGFGKIKYCATE